MQKNNKICLIFLVFQLFAFGCTLPYQLKSYTEYRLHDIKVEDDHVIILLEKEHYRPKIEISGAVMGEMSGKSSLNQRSFALLFFNEKDIFSKSNAKANLDYKKNIITKKDLLGNKHLQILDNKKIISSSDIINDKLCSSLLYLNHEIQVKHITCKRNESFSILSFDKKVYFYTLANKIFLYDIEKNIHNEISSPIYKENFIDQFKNTKYVSNEGKTFFDFTLTNDSNNPVKFTIIEKQNGKVIGQLTSRFRKILDYQDYKNIILAFKPPIGFEIFDINGNSLYALHENSLSFIQRAVLHNDKVYAAGLVSKEDTFGKAQYIELLVWDYKNGITTRKNYPCDSPELEM